MNNRIHTELGNTNSSRCSVPSLTTFIPNSISFFFVFGSDIYFIGGFGTVAWVDVKEFETLQPDKIAVDGGEQYLKVNFLNSYSGIKGNNI